MRSRGLSFADAVKLLDGDSPEVAWLGQLAGVAAGAVTVASVGSVDFFALRDQVIKWGNSALRSWREKVRGLSRFDRTDRLIAAHSVIMTVAFFEALDEQLAARGIDLGAARLTAAEQTALAGGHLTNIYQEMVDELISGPAPYPSPDQPFEKAAGEVQLYFGRVAARVLLFLHGLEAYADAGPTLMTMTTSALPLLARRRYEEHFRRLAAEIPEFRLWSAMNDAQATRAMIREAIDELRSSSAAVDGVRAGLARRYRAPLEKPILSSQDAPGDLVMPTLRRGYVPPTGLVASAGPGDLPASESWWQHRPHNPDIPDFLWSVLTAPGTTDQPIVVLGHPGSGKSVLTRILAAQLSDANFLPVRVELRNVRADSPPQTQIEQALYLLLGESLTWPDVVRHAGGALPVVMMDGFDELLQATGQNWADYLEQLRDFQQREAELGRPLAVLVTSRTVVADRARFPAGTLVMRLNPFSDEQVESWLAVWNSLNGTNLTPAAVLAHRELAEQPLLLLMLALFNGRADRLREADAGLGRVELYERLFQDFFERQVDKFDGELTPAERDAEVAAEWRRLSAVAVAMHNRGRDVILEPELADDLGHLLSPEDWTPGEESRSRRPLTAEQLLVGRFFFVHESRASLDTGAAERSFEFLHATFAEFLAARQIVAALVELAEDRSRLRRHATLDAGFFHALTSFTTVTRRAPLWEFCTNMIARFDDRVREACRDLVLELLPDAGYQHPTWSFAQYEPQRLTAAEQQTVFSANLMCLAVLLNAGPIDAAAVVGEPVPTNWRRQALLWMSQLDPVGSSRLWRAFRVEWDLTRNPSRLLIRPEDGSDVRLATSLPWPPESRPRAEDQRQDAVLTSTSTAGLLLRKSAFAQTTIDAREVFYVLTPFLQRFGDIVYRNGVKWDSDARLLWEAMLGAPPGTDRQERADLYRWLLTQVNPVKARALEALDRENQLFEISALAALYQSPPS